MPQTDLAVHYLYTFYQQSHPWLSLSLSQGVFSAVFDFSESEYLPKDAVIRISPGCSEVSQLKSVISALQDSSISRNELAYIFAKERYDVKIVSEEILKIFNSCKLPLVDLLARWEQLNQVGRKDLINQNLLLDESQHTEAVNKIYMELGWL